MAKKKKKLGPLQFCNTCLRDKDCNFRHLQCLCFALDLVLSAGSICSLSQARAWMAGSDFSPVNYKIISVTMEKRGSEGL